MDPERWTNFLPVAEGEDHETSSLDKPGRLFWLFAVFGGPLVNATLGWWAVFSDGHRGGAIDFTRAVILVAALVAMELGVLASLAGRAGIPVGHRRRKVLRDGLLVLLFATGVAAALESFFLASHALG